MLYYMSVYNAAVYVHTYYHTFVKTAVCEKNTSTAVHEFVGGVGTRLLLLYYILCSAQIGMCTKFNGPRVYA